jgi:hypothetical protein
MARQACHPHEKAIFASPWGEEWVLKFFALIQQQMLFDGIHTCNDQCQRPACVAIRRAVERERGACATLAEFNQSNHLEHLTAEQIRARRQA